MTDYRTHVDEDRRLVILRFLQEAQAFQLNESVMQSMLEQIGHSVSRDQIRTDFAWLKEQGLVITDDFHGRVHVAQITVRGSEVARGMVTVPGVKKPAPGG